MPKLEDEVTRSISDVYYMMRLYTEEWVEATHPGYEPVVFSDWRIPVRVVFNAATGKGSNIKSVATFTKEGYPIYWSKLDNELRVDRGVNLIVTIGGNDGGGPGRYKPTPPNGGCKLPIELTNFTIVTSNVKQEI